MKKVHKPLSNVMAILLSVRIMFLIIKKKTRKKLIEKTKTNELSKIFASEAAKCEFIWMEWNGKRFYFNQRIGSLLTIAEILVNCKPSFDLLVVCIFVRCRLESVENCFSIVIIFFSYKCVCVSNVQPLLVNNEQKEIK